MTRIVGRARARRALLGIGACLAVACEPPVTPDMIVPDPVRTGAPSSGPGAGAADLEVHEWGLLDVSSRGARLLAGPPSGPTNWSAPRKKPVVYLHVPPGTPAFRASVTVEVPAPGIVEQFPRGALSPDGTALTWAGLVVRPEACRVTGAPSKESPAACGAPDGLCEAADVGRYEALDAACLGFEGGAFNHLFYRAEGPPPTLPFDVTVDPDRVTITHARASDLVGPILFVHNDGGAVSVSELAPPPLGQSVRVGPPAGGDPSAARRTIDATMRAVGLTPDEIAAFDRAWANDLFGEAAAKDVAKKSAPAAEDYLLFAMPASLVDGASRLVVRPAPRAVRRFLLVRVRV
jgi:hypothetical protein